MPRQAPRAFQEREGSGIRSLPRDLPVDSIERSRQIELLHARKGKHGVSNEEPGVGVWRRGAPDSTTTSPATSAARSYPRHPRPDTAPPLAPPPLPETSVKRAEM